MLAGDGVEKIPDNTICLFQLKGQLKSEYLDASIMDTEGGKILHKGVPPSLELSGVTNYGRLMINCEQKYRLLSRVNVAMQSENSPTTGLDAVNPVIGVIPKDPGIRLFQRIT